MGLLRHTMAQKAAFACICHLQVKFDQFQRVISHGVIDVFNGEIRGLMGEERATS